MSGGTVVGIDTIKRREQPQVVAVNRRRPWKNPRHAHVVYTVPRSVRRVRDVVWTAIISIILASIAVLAGVIGPLLHVELTPLVEGAGLASIAFGLAGLSDKFDPHSRG